jgi:putative nucleotidyltransferase with HDIG domain
VRSGPPRLLVKTLTVTFLTVFALLATVFALTTMRARDQLRQSVVSNLESSQRLFAALEQRRQIEWRAQATNLAESPTLKAAIDTYAAELRGSSVETRRQLLATMQNELEKVAALAGPEVDAIVLLDARRRTLASAGRLADEWPEGRQVDVATSQQNTKIFDGVVTSGNRAFRVATVPLVLGDGAAIGTLYAATSLDQAYVGNMKRLSRSDVAIVSDGTLLTSTLPGDRARTFEASIREPHSTAGTAQLGGESFAYQQLASVGDTVFYALASVDQSSQAALRLVWRDFGIMALGATCLALLGSVWLAHQLSTPIRHLSTSLEQRAAAHDLGSPLAPTGSSHEIDALTETFNRLMTSVAAAEAHTQAAYSGAIQALATALDARDPYTAGHSERVSVLSVAIGRVLNLSENDLEVIRLGALLHDIGKIGVPDDILRKPGPLTPAEYDAIKQHPVHGARILRSVRFLADHLPIVELHHERPDGHGYPHGLHGNATPLLARVVHVADAYDAITSARAYRGAWTNAEALRELWRGAGTKFDTEIVGALVVALPAVTSTDQEEAALAS